MLHGGISKEKILELWGVKELLKIERKLERALSRARQKKTQVLLQRLEELRKMEHDLGEENKQMQIEVCASSFFFPQSRSHSGGLTDCVS
ncbi:unnamed protein product [Linum trigynum]|uniref:K-box domain-containing protein n=1 Tax=Linum trigynum TaxID=586398 RepID=A0AAV2FTR6_9ROSI